MFATTTASETRRDGSFDVVTLLTVFLAVLFIIPSRLIVAPLGSAGTPAEIISMGMFAAWIVHRVSNGRRPGQVRQPIRILMACFVVAVVLSYVAANLRPMMPDEARSADAGILLVCAWLGILLMSMDGIDARTHLDTLLRRLVVAAGGLATLGIAQFVTGQTLTNVIQIPGLSSHNSAVGLGDRNGLARVVGTTLHPIEFGAVLTMCLPFALHYALTDTGRSLLRRWYPVAAIAAAVPLSVSRSAIVSAAVVLCVLLPTWAPALRRRAYAALIVLAGAAFVAVPGLISTLSGLFTGISTDNSAQSRSDSFALAFEFIGRAPIFGRGFQTFLPSYRILDDQYLGLAIDTGIVGLMAFLGLLVAGVFSGFRLRRIARDKDAGLASLGIAFAASTGSALASFALFDAFSFPMATSLLFFILGCCGALRRLAATHAMLDQG